MAFAEQTLLFFIVALVFGIQQVANCQNVTEECVALTSKPKPVIGHYAFNDTGTTNQTVTCILAQFSAIVEIEVDRYILFNNGTVNKTASRCGIPSSDTSLAKLVIDYDCGHQIGLAFKGSSDGPTYLVSLDGRYNDSTKMLTFGNNSVDSIITSDAGYHYKCNAEQAIHLNFNQDVPMTNPNMLFLSNFTFEVFRKVESLNFTTPPQLCSLDEAPSKVVLYIVVIGVSVLLLASIGAIPVYYFLRKRNQAGDAPYQQM